MKATKKRICEKRICLVTLMILTTTTLILIPAQGLSEVLGYYTGTTAGYSYYGNSFYVPGVKYELPQSDQAYQVLNIAVYSKGDGATFPANTRVAIKIFDESGDLLFESGEFDLGGDSASVAWREFDISNSNVRVTNSFYAGIEERGSAFEFGIGFDSPLGNNYGRSYEYRNSTEVWSLHDQDWRVAATVTQVVQGPVSHTLEIVTAHGTPTPAAGTYTNDYGTVLTNTVNSPDAQGTTQYVNTGWSMTGNEPVSGGTTSVVMTVTNDATLTWQWQTQYRLDTEAGANGSVDEPDQWVDSGSNVTVTATADAYYHFTNWTGDASGSVNPLELLIDAPKSVTANFAADLATHGTPHWWLAEYGLTNDGATFDEAETNDVDDDTFSAHDERIADTNPTNKESLFHLTEVSATNSCTITFACTNSRIYSLEFNDSLVTGDWSLVTGAVNQPGDSSGSMSLTDTNDVEQRLYRVGVTIP